MSKKLFAESFAKFIGGFTLTALMIFIPAGSLHFANGWIFLSALFVPMFFAGLFMMRGNPELLKKRLYVKEKQKGQKAIVAISGAMFVIGFIISGLDFRFGWSSLPRSISLGALTVFLISYLLYARVLSENPYLSRTVEIQKDHKVIDTGLYSVVRHPMYSVTVAMFLMMPLILGSVYSFFVFLIYPFIISARIIEEEKFLEKELKGYQKYKKEVKYRLIPFIW